MLLVLYLLAGAELVPRTASSEERVNRIVLWPVWPPRTIKCNNNDDNDNDNVFFGPVHAANES